MTTLTKEQYNETIEEIHDKINKVEKNGDKCCSECYTKAKYFILLDEDDGEYRCGNHSKSALQRIIRQKI